MSVSVPAFGEPICIVRLGVPRCSRVFGQSPCTATGEACYQTSATCKDPVNFANDTPLNLYFGIPGQTPPTDAITVLPFLQSPPETTPQRVNIAGSDGRVSPLGLRATARLQFHDVPHTDRGIDPYRSSRSYDPMQSGTFWARFQVRHAYQRHRITVSVFEGFAGDALADMDERVYVFDSLDFSGEGTARIEAVDPLSRASGDKAQVPPTSPGYLSADVDETATTINVINAAAADYPASGTLRIGDEVMTYTARADAASGVDFTGITRGTDNTEADSHDVRDAVQECYRMTGLSTAAALADVMTYTPIDAAFLPTVDWAAESDEFVTSYLLTGLLTEPTPVQEVIGEICEQTQTILWWDEAAQEIQFRAIRPLAGEVPKVIDEDQIEASSFSVREFPKRRLTRVAIYYQQRDPTESRTKKTNYSRVQLSVDLASEGDARAGEPAIREIFARFLTSEPMAIQTANRLLRRYSGMPREASFTVSDRDSDLQVGETFYLRHRRLQTASGAADDDTLWIVSQRKTIPSRRRVQYVAEDATLVGRSYRIAPDGTADYQGGGADDPRYAWIAEDTGLMPDGAPGYGIQ